MADKITIKELAIMCAKEALSNPEFSFDSPEAVVVVAQRIDPDWKITSKRLDKYLDAFSKVHDRVDKLYTAYLTGRNVARA